MAFDAKATTQLKSDGQERTVKVDIHVEGPHKLDLDLSVRGERLKWTVPFDLFDKVLNDGRRDAKKGSKSVSQDGDKVKVVVDDTELLMPKWYMEQVARTLKSLYGTPKDTNAWDGGLLPDDMP